MSIRSTNVYEEKSLGIFHNPETEEPQLDRETADREAGERCLQLFTATADLSLSGEVLELALAKAACLRLVVAGHRCLARVHH